MPMRINTLQSGLKLRKISGYSISAKSPNVITAMVYIIRFSNSAAMTAVAGIPSRIIKKALAGCPPDADGVIAEK